MSGVEEIRVGGFVAHRLRSGGAFAEVLTQLGGTVHRIGLEGAGEEVAELLAAAEPRELQENPWFRGRLLFPFNDRIPLGRYLWKGRPMQLPVNSPEDGSAIHGFVYDRPFDVVELRSAEEGAALLRLSRRIAAREVPGYPFDVTLEATYLLSPRRFTLELRARNDGSESAPVTFGWHPYLTLGEQVDGLHLRTASEAYVPVGEDLMPSGEILPVENTDLDFRTGREIGRRPLDVALTAPVDRKATLRSRRACIQLELDGNAFRYLQIFVHPDRESIAIEPVTAATNAFNLHKLGLCTLEPGAVLSGRATVTYEPR